MKKLLLAISVLLVLGACKPQKRTERSTLNSDSGRRAESLRVIAPPASDNPNFDSLKHELDKKRREKEKKK